MRFCTPSRCETKHISVQGLAYGGLPSHAPTSPLWHGRDPGYYGTESEVLLSFMAFG